MSDSTHEDDHPRRPNKFAILAACIFGLIVGIVGMRSYMQMSDAAPAPIVSPQE